MAHLFDEVIETVPERINAVPSEFETADDQSGESRINLDPLFLNTNRARLSGEWHSNASTSSYDGRLAPRGL